MSRDFKLDVRLPPADKKKKKWTVVDGPLYASASSIEELCSQIHSKLLAMDQVDSTSMSVAIEGILDEDGDWPGVDSLDDIPDAAKVS